MSSLFTGISLHPALPGFLAEQYHIKVVDQVNGWPVFQDAHQISVGGFRGFYGFWPESTIREVQNFIQMVRHQFSGIHIPVSTPVSSFGSGRVNYVRILKGQEDQEARFRSYDKKTRNQVRQAQQQRFQIRNVYDASAFYDLYQSSMHRLGSEPKPRLWFENLVRNFGSDFICLSLWVDDQLIGVNAGLRFQDYFLLLTNLSLSSYWPQRINHLLYDELIHWASQSGIHFLDFGPGMERDRSHHHFKEGFGAQPYYLIDDVGLWTIGQIKRKIRNLFSV